MTDSERTARAAQAALELAAKEVSDDVAKAELSPVLPATSLLGDVRRRIRSDDDAGPEQRRLALKYVYVASREARKRVRKAQPLQEASE